MHVVRVSVHNPGLTILRLEVVLHGLHLKHRSIGTSPSSVPEGYHLSKVIPTSFSRFSARLVALLEHQDDFVDLRCHSRAIICDLLPESGVAFFERVWKGWVNLGAFERRSGH